MDPVKRSAWRTGVVVLFVFLAGVVAGGFASRAVQQRRMRELVMGDPAIMRTRLTLYALDQRLSLTPTQRAEAERVLHEQEPRYRDALERSRPEVRELRKDMAKRLEPSLTADQRAVLEELVREGERYR